jgi:competence protein ComEC
MYVSSLAHVLSISGYHMAVVAGIVFFIFRASLALIPALAIRRPIKKWAALAALAAAAFYLVLSGAEVATQRSFIMIAIVLIGVMFDRPALTLRTLTIAALAVLLLAPEAVVHPSFQMSFAATLALVAAYQNGLPWRADADSSIHARAALWGAREVAGLLLASLIAGLATTPYAAFHFHRLAPYGVVANLLAMPVVSLVVMPAGILGLVAMPFGFDAPLWRLMGLGLDWMIFIAQWVANLPGAVGRMAAFGTGPLLLGTGGLLLICLLRTRLRWSGALLVVAGSLWAAGMPQPDVYIAGDGRSAALRAESGRLSVMQSGRDTFASREWLAADADGRLPDDKTLKDGVRCDDKGCVGRLKDGRLVALANSADALPEDCVRSNVVISAREGPADCKALLFDRRRRGSGAISLAAGSLLETPARPSGHDRPWSRRLPAPASVTPPALRDAAPREGDLDAGD